MGLSELEQRIEKGIRRITEAKAEVKEVSDWDRHLKKMHREYKEKLLEQTFDEIKEHYMPGLYQWIEDNEQELLKELQEIEDELSISIVSGDELGKYKRYLERFKEWHYKAIAAYKAKSDSTACKSAREIRIEAGKFIKPHQLPTIIKTFGSKQGEGNEVKKEVGNEVVGEKRRNTYNRIPKKTTLSRGY